MDIIKEQIKNINDKINNILSKNTEKENEWINFNKIYSNNIEKHILYNVSNVFSDEYDLFRSYTTKSLNKYKNKVILNEFTDNNLEALEKNFNFYDESSQIYNEYIKYKNYLIDEFKKSDRCLSISDEINFTYINIIKMSNKDEYAFIFYDDKGNQISNKVESLNSFFEYDIIRQLEEFNSKLYKSRDHINKLTKEINNVKIDQDNSNNDINFFTKYPSHLDNSERYIFNSICIPRDYDIKDNTTRKNYDSGFMVKFNFKNNNIDEPDFDKKKQIYSLSLRLLNRGTILHPYSITEDILKSFFTNSSNNTLVSIKNNIKFNNEIEENFFYDVLFNTIDSSLLSNIEYNVNVKDILSISDPKSNDIIIPFVIYTENKKYLFYFDKSHYSLLNNSYNKNTEKIFINPEKLEKTIAEAKNKLTKDKDIKNLKSSVYNKEVYCNILVHQIAIAVLKGLEKGFLTCKENIKISIDNEILGKDEQELVLSLAINEVLLLYKNYSYIYENTQEINLLNKDVEPTYIVLNNSDDSLKRSISINPKKNVTTSGKVDAFNENILPKRIELEQANFFLKYIFNFDELREGQFNAIEKLLHRKDCLVLLTTGAGKSIIYQLSSYLCPGIIVIISPLVSLMEDQKLNLYYNNGIDRLLVIHGGSKDTKKSQNEIQNINDNIVTMIYISPERIHIPTFRDLVETIKENNLIYSVTIDEAHSISEWGHDFRPAYDDIANVARQNFIKNNYIPSVFALTGTASLSVIKDIEESLKITEVIASNNFNREELNFYVYRCDDEQKFETISKIIDEDIPKLFSEDKDKLYKLKGKDSKAGIIFTPYTCPTKNYNPIRRSASNPAYYTELVYSHVRRFHSFVNPGKYYSTIPQCLKDKYDEFHKKPKNINKIWKRYLNLIAMAFKKNKKNLICATKAFGTGIDKGNIRYVIHTCITNSLEQYFQEAGRAGRNKDSAHCFIIFSNDKNKYDYEYMLEENTDIKYIQQYFKTNSACNNDLGVQLSFHSHSFKGLEFEIEITNAFIDILSTNDEVHYIKIDKIHNVLKNTYKSSINFEDKDCFKAVIRLKKLGIIKDYTFDYRYEMFSIINNKYDINDVKQNLEEYIFRQNQDLYIEIRKFNRNITENTKENIKLIAKKLIEYIYNKNERQQRLNILAVYNVLSNIDKNLSPAEKGKILKDKILKHLNAEYNPTDKFDIILIDKINYGINHLNIIVKDILNAKTINNNSIIEDFSININTIRKAYTSHPLLALMDSLSTMLMYYDKDNNDFYHNRYVESFVNNIENLHNLIKLNEEDIYNVFKEEILELLLSISNFDYKLFWNLIEQISIRNIIDLKDSIKYYLINSNNDTLLENLIIDYSTYKLGGLL